ncbi:hypothetical protein DL771_005376 [Monosporascus sp. 5C6A]|nr:hypothetical protein DL771_005376 [Monosporascus sp. 5C6A]
MEIDPIILAAFGPPPEGMDLTEDQSQANNIAVVVCLALAAVALVLRIWARNLQNFGVKADDYLIMVALVFVCGTVGLTIAGGHFGGGRHLWANSIDEVSMTFKMLYCYTYIYAGSVSFTKFSILLFYSRIFSRGTTWFKIRLAFAAFLSIAYPISIWGVMAGACKPINFFWNQFKGAEGKCIDINTPFMVLTVANMVNDIIVLLVPIPEILQLQMSNRKKAGVTGIMLLGAFVCVASIVRIWAFAEYINSIDLTWNLAGIFLWSSIEPAVAIISACLPVMRPLVRLGRDKITTKSGSHGGSSNNWSRKYAPGGGVNSYVRFGGDKASKSSEEDEIALTTIAQGAGSQKRVPNNVIMVKSEISQSGN